MRISVVIPTCNRKESLLRTLACLNKSDYPLEEVIIIDSSDEKISPSSLQVFSNLKIIYLESIRSVCIQRNMGIQQAKSEWIFLCDDDLEIPTNYLTLLINHIRMHAEVGAASGLVLQRENGNWTSQYPITSSFSLLWRFIFGLSIWGAIQIENSNPVITRIKKYYARSGNHISKAGWPVITNFAGEYFTTPIYGLGASLVLRKWLIDSPYDEVLDSHGIGDNYGVALGFPGEINIVTAACVYHHQEKINRLSQANQYFQRVLALDYFLQSKEKLKSLNRNWFLWSLAGNGTAFVFAGKTRMARVTLKAIFLVLFNKNPLVLKK